MIWKDPDSFGEVVNRAMRLVESRYAKAAAAFVCGSVIRGDATVESDYDMVIVFPQVENAWRESFIFENRKIEAFVHDPETLRWFFEKEDAASGVPSLPNMVNHGLILKNLDGIADQIKEQAHKLLLLGPKPLSPEQIDNYRYFINDLCDDLKFPRSFEESIAVASRLYSLLAEFYLRSNGYWSASGKSIPRALKQVSPEFSYRFNEAFKLLFSSEMTYQVIALAEETLRPWGGMLFDGYHRQAPAKFRLKRPGRRKNRS
ncbi:MAG: nucleotidyltransferase domain-containing protein [Candidatus Riflebacteria bacterium]